MLNANKYQYNRAFEIFDEQTRKRILDWFNQVHRHMLYANEKYIKTGRQSDHLFYFNKLQSIIGAQRMLEEIGVYVESGWHGHEGYFFPTYEDALFEEDCQFQNAD